MRFEKKIDLVRDLTLWSLTKVALLQIYDENAEKVPFKPFSIFFLASNLSLKIRLAISAEISRDTVPFRPRHGDTADTLTDPTPF